MFGNPETTTGGHALKFYASVRLDIRRVSSIKNGDEVIGNRTRVKVVKNKVAPPFKSVEFDIIYGKGISKVGEIIDVGIDSGVLRKSGSWFSYNENKLSQGRETLKTLLTDNKELCDKIGEEIRTNLKNCTIKHINENQSENLETVSKEDQNEDNIAE
jgi:recombination protein RecA